MFFSTSPATYMLKEGLAQTAWQMRLDDAQIPYKILALESTPWKGRSSCVNVGLDTMGSGEEKAGTAFKPWHFCPTL